jgi:hypothetical protein
MSEEKLIVEVWMPPYLRDRIRNAEARFWPYPHKQLPLYLVLEKILDQWEASCQ